MTEFSKYYRDQIYSRNESKLKSLIKNQKLFNINLISFGNEVVAIFTRCDCEVNINKVKRSFKSKFDGRILKQEDLIEKKYIFVKILIDETLINLDDISIQESQVDLCIMVNLKDPIKSSISEIILELEKIVSTSTTGDYQNTKEGYSCLNCNKGKLENKKAIEVGHTFYLGTKYSEPFEANFKDRHDKLNTTKMGCFGIGVSRLVSAICESSHDSKGMVWPVSVSPFIFCILPIYTKQLEMNSDFESNILNIYSLINNEFKDEVILDDRKSISSGQKIKNATSIGYPYLIILGKQLTNEGLLEIHERKTGAISFIHIDNFKADFLGSLQLDV